MTAEIKRVPIPRRGVDYRGKVVLAPMVRSGELPSRLLALHYGADLVWGPETIDRAVIGTTRRYNKDTGVIEWTRQPSQGQKNPPADAKESLIYRVFPEAEANKLVFQIGTADPDRAVEAARLVAADVAGIDVNAGCPKPFSTSGGMGAALLQTPDKLVAILEALVQNITPEFEIGISVKIRILETPAETEVLVRRLVATGITGLTVHCRTTPMRPRERAIRDQLRMVADVCREAGVACLMNGDVETRDEGLRLAREYGADGAMIAVAAEKNPSCFRSEADGGVLPWQPVVEQYIRFSLDISNRFSNTKYLLAQMVPGKAKFHPSVNQAKNYTDLCNLFGFHHLLQQARQVDVSRGLDKPLEKAPKNVRKNASALAAGGQTVQNKQQRKALSERGPSSKTRSDARPEPLPSATPSVV
ncbi:hypothetical protein E4U21_002155 [Claviceps maximensis]|nr:hypothetical protein E4U21_002155 [Claviceps maximensis]